MGQVFSDIDERNAAFIRKQHVFFVATAPLAAEGLVNLSPKGLESFAILGPRQVAYLDLVGSGVETIAHLRENRRIVMMFCSFEGPPRILRLHGLGDVVEPGDDGFEVLVSHFPRYRSTRAVIRVDVTRIADSCGYGVPLYRFEGPRPQLLQWADRRDDRGLLAYQDEHNRKSLDGLPGLRRSLP